MSTSSSPFSFPPDLAQFVQQEVSSGKYQSTEEVVCQGLRVLQAREQRLEALRREILPALERLDRGEGIVIDGDEELDAFFDNLIREAEQELDAENHQS